jgi:predicted Rossmann-fold nucleotide-binding protein
MQIAGKSKSFLKPVIVLNTNGIYDDLKSQMRKLIAEGFIHPGREKLIRSVDSPEEVIQKLQRWNSEGVLRACEVANTNAPLVQKPQGFKIG